MSAALEDSSMPLLPDKESTYLAWDFTSRQEGRHTLFWAVCSTTTVDAYKPSMFESYHLQFLRPLMFSNISFELQCKISVTLAICLLHCSIVNKINMWILVHAHTTFVIYSLNNFTTDTHDEMQEGQHLLIWHTSVKAIIDDQHLCAWNIFSNDTADLIAHAHQDLFYWISKQYNIMIQLFEFYK